MSVKITESRLRRIIREEIESTATESSKRKIFVLVGPPSIGKSTWISKTFSDIDPYIISRDDVVDSVASSYGWTYDDMFVAPPKDAVLGDEDKKYGEVVQSPSYMTWQPLSYSNVLDANGDIQNQFSGRVSEAANSGLDIVVDMTNMNARARQGALAAIKGREAEFEKIAVVFPFQGAEDVVKRVAAKRAADTKARGGSKTIPPAAMDRMMSSFENVTSGEGFDKVIEFDNRPALRALVGAGEQSVAQESAIRRSSRRSTKLTESKLRQIIREELNEMIGGPGGKYERPVRGRYNPYDDSEEEVPDQDPPGPGDLKILGYEWIEEYNDPEMGSQQGDLVIDFSIDDDKIKAKYTLTSFILSKESVVEDITYAINEELGESEQVDEAAVAEALGPNMLNDIMAELAESQRAYQAQADANSRYY